MYTYKIEVEHDELVMILIALGKQRDNIVSSFLTKERKEELLEVINRTIRKVENSK